MKDRYLSLFLSLVVALFLATPTFAQEILFTGAASGDPGYGPESGSAGVYNGYVLTGGQPISTNFVCDDYNHTIGGGQNWSVTVTQYAVQGVSSGVEFDALPNGLEADEGLGSGAPSGNTNLSNADFKTGGSIGNITIATEYDMIAWLVTEILDNPSATANNAAYNGAIWAITDDGWNTGDYTSIYNGGSLDAATAVTNAYNAVRLDGWTPPNTLYIYTPTGQCTTVNGYACNDAAQEFWGQTPVPDGGMTLMLLGSALVGLATLRRKFRS